jgi:hypothetical protein
VAMEKRFMEPPWLGGRGCFHEPRGNRVTNFAPSSEELDANSRGLQVW